MRKIYVESKEANRILTKAFFLQNNPNLKTHLIRSIQKCRTYLRDRREGHYSYVDGLPCGSQDAHCDRVYEMFVDLQIYMIAYSLQSGDATRAFKCFNRMIGN